MPGLDIGEGKLDDLRPVVIRRARRTDVPRSRCSNCVVFRNVFRRHARRAAGRRDGPAGGRRTARSPGRSDLQAHHRVRKPALVLPPHLERTGVSVARQFLAGQFGSGRGAEQEVFADRRLGVVFARLERGDQDRSGLVFETLAQCFAHLDDAAGRSPEPAGRDRRASASRGPE